MSPHTKRINYSFTTCEYAIAENIHGAFGIQQKKGEKRVAVLIRKIKMEKKNPFSNGSECLIVKMNALQNKGTFRCHS